MLSINYIYIIIPCPHKITSYSLNCKYLSSFGEIPSRTAEGVLTSQIERASAKNIATSMGNWKQQYFG